MYMETTAFLFAAAIGFSHAFEADHLVAVSSIVTRRNSMTLAIKDGAYWGAGHTATILLIGVLFLMGKLILPEAIFSYFEAAVGLMLIGLGTGRLLKAFRQRHEGLKHTHTKDHGLAFGVGLLHGLAGSGVLVLSVLGTSESVSWGLGYLMVFGIGSVAGMMVAAGVFSLPFSGKLFKGKTPRLLFTLVSAVLCLGLGAWLLYENLF